MTLTVKLSTATCVFVAESAVEQHFSLKSVATAFIQVAAMLQCRL